MEPESGQLEASAAVYRRPGGTGGPEAAPAVRPSRLGDAALVAVADCDCYEQIPSCFTISAFAQPSALRASDSGAEFSAPGYWKPYLFGTAAIAGTARKCRGNAPKCIPIYVVAWIMETPPPVAGRHQPLREAATRLHRRTARPRAQARPRRADPAQTGQLATRIRQEPTHTSRLATRCQLATSSQPATCTHQRWRSFGLVRFEP